jgi:outer membrane protein
MRILSIFLLFAAVVSAQAPREPVRLSLKRAVELATSQEGSAKIQLSGEALRQAQSRSTQSRAALLPDLSAAFSEQSRTMNLASMGLSFRIPGFSLPAIAGPFTVVDARVSGSQTIFDFASLRRFQASKVGVSAARADVNSSEEQVSAQVARAYMAAVKSDADVEAAQSNASLAQAVLDQAESQKSAGTGTGIEVTRARVQLANDRQRLLASQNARRAAHLQLLRAMGMRLDSEVELTDQLEYAPVDPVTLEQARAQALKARPDYIAQQSREDTARLSASATKLERLPTVAAMADYGPNGTGYDNARPTRTYGISVKIPIFDGGRRDARRVESASQYRAEKVRSNDIKEQIELDVRLAMDALQSAEDQVKVAIEGLDLAKSELAQARRRYEAGVANQLEVTDAQTRLERAQDNRIAALYSYNVSRVDLAQAMGNVRSLVK